MSFDAFLVIDGIPGESNDDRYKNSIEVRSFGHGVNLDAPESKSSGATGGGRVDVHELSIVKSIDASTPKLFLACCTGQVLPSVKLVVCKAVGAKQKYLEYKLTDALVTSAGPGGDKDDEESVPTESVSFSFTKIELIYTKLDAKTGASKGDVTACFDLTTNIGK